MSHKKQHLLTSTADHDVTGLTASDLLRVNAGGTAMESAGKTADDIGDALKIQGNNVQVLTLGAGQDGYVATWDNAAGEIQFKAASGADGNGIYGGSDSLSGNTVVTQGANTLAFKTTASNSIVPFAIQDDVASAPVFEIFNVLGSGQGGLIRTKRHDGTVTSSFGNTTGGGNLDFVRRIADNSTAGFAVVDDATGFNVFEAWNVAAGSKGGQLVLNDHADTQVVKFGGFTNDWFDTGNNFVIGTTTGSAKLHVKGKGLTTGIAFLVEDNAGTDRFFIRDDGKVGVGKSPVNGVMDFSLATEDFSVNDAGSAAATQQDWIEVTVGGVTGYIHVFATK